MDADLYDEFGNYIGPDLDDSDDEEEVEEADGAEFGDGPDEDDQVKFTNSCCCTIYDSLSSFSESLINYHMLMQCCFCHSVIFFFLFFSGTWLSYLTNFLSLRLVGTCLKLILREKNPGSCGYKPS